eukprot:598655-Pelagomonas_calceolata.AAC.1
MKAFLKGAGVQDGVVQPFSLSVGSIFCPGNGGFKDEGVLALPIHPGVVACGTWIRWQIGPCFYAGGGHFLGKEFLYDVCYLAWFSFHCPCAG